MSVPPPKPTVNIDVDDDSDLDDLDDVLPQFTAVPKTTSQSNLPTSPAPLPTATTTTTFNRLRTNTRIDAPPPSIPGRSSSQGLDAANEEDEDILAAEFARELAKGMESLVREIGEEGKGKFGAETEGEGEEDKDKEKERVFKAAWEAMLVEGMNGEGGADVAGLGELLGEGGVKGKEKGPGKGGAGGATGEKDDFQSKIRQAMDKLKESESTLQADSAPNPTAPGANADSLDALLASLGDLGLGEGGPGEENEAELAGLLENMMGQLMSKEVLYEPLKELRDKFPDHLSRVSATLPPDEMQRYESQLESVRKIMAVFDEPGYNEKDPETSKKIVELMGEMQSFGSPPAEIMGPLPPGFGLGPDGMPQMGEGCVVA